MKEKIQEIKTQVINYCRNNKKTVVVAEIFVAICLFVVIFLFWSGRNWSADKILTELMKVKKDIAVVEVQEEDLTLDHILSKAYFSDVLIKNDSYAGYIEVFENKQYALLHMEYLESLYAETCKLIDEANFGTELVTMYGAKKPNIYINGNVLLYLDSQYSTYQKNQFVKYFNQVLENDTQTEKNIPTQEVIEKIKKDNLERAKTVATASRDELVASFEEEIADLELKVEGADIDQLLQIIDLATPYKEVVAVSERAMALMETAEGKIKAEASKVDEALDEAENNLTQDLLDEAKALMESRTHEIFAQYRDGWNDRITHIQWAINDKIIQDYKNNCTSYDYDEIMADVNSYIDDYAYFRGKVVEVTQISSGTLLRVNVTPVYGIFSDNILYWEDSIYVELASDIGMSISKNNLIELWGQIKGTTTHNSNFGGSQTTLKFYARYAEVN